MNLWKLLGYLGLLPFVGALCLHFLPVYDGAAPSQIFIFYSAIIVSFLCGTLWTGSLGSERSQSNLGIYNVRIMQIVSNVISLTAFICLLLPVPIALLILALSYLSILIAERKLMPKELINHSYMTMRLLLTLVVVGLHIVAISVWTV